MEITLINQLIKNVNDLESRVRELERLVETFNKAHRAPEKKNKEKYYNGDFELCIIQQERYGDRWGEWREDHFRSIGERKFSTEDELMDYLNGDVQNWDREHYMILCEGRKIYVHNIKKNTYKRIRTKKTSDGECEYYLKK